MTFRSGDPVLADRPLGFIDRFPEGTFGIVQHVTVLGEHTVEFDNGQTLHGLWDSDFTRAVPPTPW